MGPTPGQPTADLLLKIEHGMVAMGRACREFTNLLLTCISACPPRIPRSDFMVLQDPYVFLKRPPLGHANLLSAAESGCGMNGGFVYIQNTRPDGPVAWLFHRTTEVPLR